MATYTNIGNSQSNANPATSVPSFNTTAATAAADKIIAIFTIPNSNPTSISVTIGGNAMTEITGSRSVRSNNTVVAFYYDDATGMASGQAVVSSWTNSGTQSGGGACVTLVTMAGGGGRAHATGQPESVATAINGAMSGAGTTTSNSTAAGADSSATYTAVAIIGYLNTVAAQISPDNAYSVVTENINTTRGIGVQGGCKEFAPAVAGQAETWTATWVGTHSWFSNIFLVKQVAAGVPVISANPTVSGTLTVGSTLTGTNGSWTNSPSSFTYQWQRDVGTSGATWLNITGATANTYALTASDIGSKHRIQVIATNGSGSSSPAFSSATGSTIPAPTGVLTPRVIAGPLAQSDAQVHLMPAALPVLSGDTVVVFAACSNANTIDGNSNRSDVGSITDGLGNTYTQDLEAFNDTNIVHSGQAFSKLLGSAMPYGTNIVMTVNGCAAGVTCGAPGYHGQSPFWYAVAISPGGMGTIALDVAAKNVDGPLTTHTGPSITTTKLNAVILGFHTMNATAGAGWWTPAAGMTEIVDTDLASNLGGESAYSISGELKVVTAGFSGVLGATSRDTGQTTNLALAYAVPDPGGVPVNSVAPAVTGTAQQGSTLSTTDGSWSLSPTSFTYQWQMDTAGNGTFANIGGATSNTLVLGAGQVGNKVRCQVTAINGSGSSTPANSNQTALVLGPNPVNTVAPGVTGTTVQGQTLSTTDGTWDITISSFAYQWQRDVAGNGVFSNIGAATSNTYVLAAGDVGNKVRCHITATATGGGTGTADSNQVGLVTAPTAPVNTVAPVISGIPYQAYTLTTDNGSWTQSPSSYAYQWQRDVAGNGVFSNIASATNATYVLQAADLTNKVRCVVTATNAVGSTSANSNQLGPITTAPVGGTKIYASGAGAAFLAAGGEL